MVVNCMDMDLYIVGVTVPENAHGYRCNNQALKDLEGTECTMLREG